MFRSWHSCLEFQFRVRVLVWFLGPIINTSGFFSVFSSKKLFVIQFFYIDFVFHKFLNLVCFTGP